MCRALKSIYILNSILIRFYVSCTLFSIFHWISLLMCNWCILFFFKLVFKKLSFWIVLIIYISSSLFTYYYCYCYYFNAIIKLLEKNFNYDDLYRDWWFWGEWRFVWYFKWFTIFEYLKFKNFNALFHLWYLIISIIWKATLNESW